MIDLRGQLTGLGEVNGEQLTERKQRYVALQEEIAGVKKEIHEGQEQMERGKKVKQLTDERVARQEEERKLLDNGRRWRVCRLAWTSTSDVCNSSSNR